jgi:hypothetical protein
MDWEWLGMTANGLGIAGNACEWIGNGWECLRMDENAWEWLGRAGKGWEGLGMYGNDSECPNSFFPLALGLYSGQKTTPRDIHLRNQHQILSIVDILQCSSSKNKFFDP